MLIKQNASVEVAAAKSGFGRTAGFAIKKELKTGSRKESKPRGSRRPDPLKDIFDSQVAPILKNCPDIRSCAVFREIMRGNPRLDPGVRRTLERRIKAWRAEHGADKDVIFRQKKEPGRVGISDFTSMNSLEITIARKSFDHKLYHFRLPWSGFVHARVVLGGESFAAFSLGLSEALGMLGGVPRECRTDSLSAAFRNLSKDEVEDMTASYRELCAHYGMAPTRNNRGVAHENGAIESSHGHLKREIGDALALRGSRDFADLDSYRDFIAGVLSGLNARRVERVETEREALGPLPPGQVDFYRRESVRVTSSGGFMLKGVFYTVPSRLIGHRLAARLYDERVELYLGDRHLLTLERGRRGSSKKTAYSVNYHHVIHSLRRKPGAFMNLVYRDELFPREEYKRCFELAVELLSGREACGVAVKLLALRGLVEFRQGLVALRTELAAGVASFASQIRSTAGQITALGRSIGRDFSGQQEAALRTNIESLDVVLSAVDLSNQQRSAVLDEQHSNIQELISLERQRFEESKRAQLATLDIQLEALRKLQTDFTGVFAAAGNTLLQLRTGGDSILSPAERLQTVRDEISGLQGRVPTAQGADFVDIQQRLTQLFPEAVRIAREGFGEGSSVAFAQFAAAEEGLKLVQEQTRQEIVTQQGLVARQNEIAARIEAVNNRQFTVSLETKRLVDVHLSNQISLLEESQTQQSRMVSELQRMNGFLRNIQSALERNLQQPLQGLSAGGS